MRSVSTACLLLLWTVSLSAQTASESALIAHSNEFTREVIRVTDGVFVAVGFGNANSILIVGDEGRIIVDTMESDDAARDVKAEFDRISRAPVRAIIYTHGHPDHIWEQTIDGMNRGLTPDQLVEAVKLPDELSRAPYLQQSYGTVPWSVRSIYAGTLGWFNGNPTELFPLSASERARRTIDLVGGEVKLLALARSALERGDVQWALELADHLLALHANLQDARLLKATALESLARDQTSANARNYYLSVAKQLRGAPR